MTFLQDYVSRKHGVNHGMYWKNNEYKQRLADR